VATSTEEYLIIDELKTSAKHREQQIPPSPYSYLLLVAAALFLSFSNGKLIIPLAAWIGPFLLVRFLRTQPTSQGLLMGYPVMFAVWCLQWRGIVRMMGPMFFVAAAVISIIGFLPYVADRWLSPRLSGLKSTLLLPVALVSMEHFFTIAGPYGSWGSIAYSQYGNLPLMQLVSVTGLWGITFLIGWGASMANFIWEKRQNPARGGRAALIFILTLASVMIYGGARLLLPLSERQAILAATISPQYDNNMNYDPALAGPIQNFLFERSEAIAHAGVRMILWPEDSFTILKRDEPATLERSRQFAQEHHVYLGIAYGARLEENAIRYENKMVMVTPAGEIAWEYLKTHPVPGFEEKNMVRGQGAVPNLDVPDGRLAAAICYDGDYPALMRQVGTARSDLLILPADDWKEIDPLHSRMSAFRAIEQGVSLVRPTMNGLSLAVNYRGEVLASMDHYATRDRVMLANMPIGSVRTLYSIVGDLFAWLAVFALLGLITLALSHRRAN
jgi:apolipoprotein N-acyltransferase